MARLPDVTREQLKPEHRPIYDEIAQSRGTVRGPYAILLHNPGLAQCIAATGSFVRFKGKIPGALREITVLATAREIKSEYEFTAHARFAREAGVSESTIQALAKGTAPRGLSGDEAMVVGFTQELLRNRKVSDGTFDAAKKRLGVDGVVELTGLIGHYQVVGNIIAAFDVQHAPGVKSELTL